MLLTGNSDLGATQVGASLSRKVSSTNNNSEPFTCNNLDEHEEACYAEEQQPPVEMTRVQRGVSINLNQMVQQLGREIGEALSHQQNSEQPGDGGAQQPEQKPLLGQSMICPPSGGSPRVSLELLNPKITTQAYGTSILEEDLTGAQHVATASQAQTGSANKYAESMILDPNPAQVDYGSSQIMDNAFGTSQIGTSQIYTNQIGTSQIGSGSKIPESSEINISNRENRQVSIVFEPARTSSQIGSQLSSQPQNRSYESRLQQLEHYK